MAGSGLTSKEVVTRLTTIAKQEYTRQLEGLPLKKATREALVDGFADGFRSAIHQLTKMEVLEVIDTTPNAERK